MSMKNSSANHTLLFYGDVDSTNPNNHDGAFQRFHFTTSDRLRAKLAENRTFRFQFKKKKFPDPITDQTF